MKFCELNHPAVAYEGPKCPVCAAQSEKAQMWDRLQLAQQREQAALKESAKSCRELAGVRRELETARGEIAEQAKIVANMLREIPA